MPAPRITRKTLERRIAYLNKKIGKPEGAVIKDADGVRFNPGAYMLSAAYGGYCLELVDSENGSTTDIFSVGYVGAKELYRLINAYLLGIEAYRNGGLQ